MKRTEKSARFARLRYRTLLIKKRKAGGSADLDIHVK